jgi:hypothetical protein
MSLPIGIELMNRHNRVAPEPDDVVSRPASRAASDSSRCVRGLADQEPRPPAGQRARVSACTAWRYTLTQTTRRRRNVRAEEDLTHTPLDLNGTANSAKHHDGRGGSGNGDGGGERDGEGESEDRGAERPARRENPKSMLNRSRFSIMRPFDESEERPTILMPGTMLLPSSASVSSSSFLRLLPSPSLLPPSPVLPCACIQANVDALQTAS